ncbi:hypothetical protein HZH68_016935 [Vespula germanica]|uniref:Uncharacterized protein n=1 Tax=Vespula germanica TaxID=30212 RepID=A0A834J1H1_VESGE|nr:hypothetical protein HZH68_016935 [Vespula germanica]
MRLLTRQETSLTIDGKRFVNQELARFLNRIVEGIKCKRRDKNYKEIVSSYINEILATELSINIIKFTDGRNEKILNYIRDFSSEKSEGSSVDNPLIDRNKSQEKQSRRSKRRIDYTIRNYDTRILVDSFDLEDIQAGNSSSVELLLGKCLDRKTLRETFVREHECSSDLATLGANLSRGNSEGDASEWYGAMSKRSNRQETQKNIAQPAGVARITPIINTRTLGALKIQNICDQVRTFVKEVTFERSFLLRRQGNNLAAKVENRSRKGTKQRTRFSGDGTKSHTESQHKEIQARSGKWHGTGICCETIYSPWPPRIATKKVYSEKCKTPVDAAGQECNAEACPLYCIHTSSVLRLNDASLTLKSL